MASKRKSRQQKRAKRQRAKHTVAKKKAFRHSLIMRDFSPLKPKSPPKPGFGKDTFEFLLAEERHSLKAAKNHRKELLFRKFQS